MLGSRPSRPLGLAFLLGCVLAWSGCAPSPMRYTKESFVPDSPYQREVAVDAGMACEGARRALLGDGYLVEPAEGATVKGRKAYRSESDRSTFVEMSVVCAADAEGATLYANGLLSTYNVKKSSGAASVGLAAFGSVSLPIGQSADSMVKTGEETIGDREFYQRFFAAVETVLAGMEESRTGRRAAPHPESEDLAAGQAAGGEAGGGTDAPR